MNLNILHKLRRYKRLPPDDFMLRLRSSVIGEGMLHDGNIYLMDLAISQLPKDGVVLEIGSHGGLSTNLLTYLMQKHGKTNPFFTCDAWIYGGYHDEKTGPTDHMDGRPEVSRLDYMTYIKTAFIQATRLLSAHQLPHSFHLTSDAFFEAWDSALSMTDLFGQTVQLGGSIAFAYIDGDHSYEGAFRDIENTLRHLVPGGMMLLDDTAIGQPYGSAQLAKVLLHDSRVERVAANPHLLLRKR